MLLELSDEESDFGENLRGGGEGFFNMCERFNPRIPIVRIILESMKSEKTIF